MSIQGQLIPGTLPPFFCGISQETYNTIIELTTVMFPTGGSPYNFGPTLPTPDNQGFPWFRLNLDGTPDKWYVFVSGSWIAGHPLLPGFTMMYDGDISTLSTFDGGDNNPPSTIAGPMWVPIVAMAGRMPINPDGAAFIQGNAGGATTHTQSIPELPVHTHPPLTVGTQFGLYQGASAVAPFWAPITGFEPAQLDATTGPTGSGTPMDIMNPWYGLPFIKRSPRLFYRL